MGVRVPSPAQKTQLKSWVFCFIHVPVAAMQSSPYHMDAVGCMISELDMAFDVLHHLWCILAPQHIFAAIDEFYKETVA